jgi:hypothetical protein
MPAVKFDTYTWRARIAPAFLMILPATVAVFLWVPDLMLASRLAGVFLGPLGIAMLMAQVGRDMGYRKQTGLWDRWGGPPTTQLLRHRSSECNPVLRESYHRKLMELRPDLGMPTPEEEEQDPERADYVYEAQVKHLIAQTRDRRRFPLVFQENVNYGFRRNLWGMKSLGAFFAAAGFVACCLKVWLVWRQAQQVSPEAAVSGLINLGLLLFWLFWVTTDWVRIAAYAYRARLFEACGQLQSEDAL